MNRIWRFFLLVFTAFLTASCSAPNTAFKTSADLSLMSGFNREYRLQVSDEIQLKFFARFPYSYFPYLDVRVDGKEAPFFRSAMHDIVVPVYLGEHTVRILGRASPLSRWTFFLSVGSIIVIILIPSRILNYFDH